MYCKSLILHWVKWIELCSEVMADNCLEYAFLDEKIKFPDH